MKMTKEETVNRLASNLKVAQAWAEGKEVEFRIQDADQTKGWAAVPNPSFDPSLEYRVKPREPREWWVNIYPTRAGRPYRTKDMANAEADANRLECILVREVTPKEPS